MADTRDLVARLDSFARAERSEALGALVAARTAPPRTGGNVNMHCHSFFSYNAEGWSPTRIAWEASQRGLYAAGLCDFDVLDGLEEFLGAGRATGLRSCVYVETRTFVGALRDVDTNSPGEHGVVYAMGAGFRRVPEPGSTEGRTLRAFRDKARERNLALVARMALSAPEVTLDYERDVLPLTPAGVATERHIVRAYVDKAMAQRKAASSAFFADLLGKDQATADRLLADRAALEEAVRARLIKRGGLAYAQPDDSWFPPLRDFYAWVTACGALPMAAWLDGTSGGEADADRFLDVMTEAGACTLNIIPDRNWNLRDPADRERKVAKLREIVLAAGRRQMPVNIGTEMNRSGLPFVDDLDGPALREFQTAFRDGARVLVGQTLLARYAGLSYAGERARQSVGADPAARNAFYAAAGALPPLTEAASRRMEEAGEERALAGIRDAVRTGRWPS